MLAAAVAAMDATTERRLLHVAWSKANPLAELRDK